MAIASRPRSPSRASRRKSKSAQPAAPDSKAWVVVLVDQNGETEIVEHGITEPAGKVWVDAWNKGRGPNDRKAFLRPVLREPSFAVVRFDGPSPRIESTWLTPSEAQVSLEARREVYGPKAKLCVLAAVTSVVLEGGVA